MNRTSRGFILTTALSLLPLGLSLHAQETAPAAPTQETQAEEQDYKVFTQIYDIPDLVQAAVDMNTSGMAPDENTDASAIDDIGALIEETIDVTSWERAGGMGSIRPASTAHQLIISQTRRAHEQIAALLTQLRKGLGTTITIQTRILCLDPARLSPEATSLIEQKRSTAENGALVLDAVQVDSLISAARAGGQQALIASPRITARNGQRSTIRIGTTTPYLAAYRVVKDAQGAVSYRPVGEKVEEGLSLMVRAVASGDGQSITLSVHPTLTYLNKMTLVPYPADVPGLNIQKPETTVRELQSTCTVRRGATFLVGPLPAQPAAARPASDLPPPGMASGASIYIVVQPDLVESPKTTLQGNR